MTRGENRFNGIVAVWRLETHRKQLKSRYHALNLHCLSNDATVVKRWFTQPARNVQRWLSDNLQKEKKTEKPAGVSHDCSRKNYKSTKGSRMIRDWREATTGLFKASWLVIGWSWFRCSCQLSAQISLMSVTVSVGEERAKTWWRIHRKTQDCD